jgi:hypothetical protein
MRRCLFLQMPQMSLDFLNMLNSQCLMTKFKFYEGVFAASFFASKLEKKHYPLQISRWQHFKYLQYVRAYGKVFLLTL